MAVFRMERANNYTVKEVPPIVEQPTDISEEWPEDVVEEPAIDFSKPSKKKATTMKVIVWVCLLNGLTKILFKSLHMILL